MRCPACGYELCATAPDSPCPECGLDARGRVDALAARSDQASWGTQAHLLLAGLCMVPVAMTLINIVAAHVVYGVVYGVQGNSPQQGLYPILDDTGPGALVLWVLALAAWLAMLLYTPFLLWARKRAAPSLQTPPWMWPLILLPLLVIPAGAFAFLVHGVIPD